MQKELSELTSRHCETLAHECAAIKESLRGLEHKTAAPSPMLKQAIVLTHKIKGSSGFAQVSECASALECHLRTAANMNAPIGHELHNRITAWCKRLEHIVSTLTSEQSSLFNSVALHLEAKSNLRTPSHLTAPPGKTDHQIDHTSAAPKTTDQASIRSVRATQARSQADERRVTWFH